MDETTCSSCGRQMSLKDLERRRFREVNDELYCPECFLKLGRPKKLRCPDCGKQTTAVLHDGKYACTHCGREIGGHQEKGVIVSAKPSGGREEPAGKTAAAPPPIHRRRKNRSVAMLAVALSCFITLSLILGALLFKKEAGRPRRSPPPAAKTTQPPVRPAPKKPLAADEEILRYARNWHKERPTNYDGAIKCYQKAVESIQDRVLAMKAKGELLDLEAKRDAAAKAGKDERIELARKLADARKQIERLTQEQELLKKKLADAETSKPPPVKTVVTPPPVVRKKSDDSARAAYEAAMARGRALIANRQYGRAMETLSSVAAKYGGTDWGVKAETERQRIRNDAYQEFNKLRVRAETLGKVGDHDGERELYAQAMMFGVPAINDIVRQKLAEIREAEKNGTNPPRAKLPAIVRQQIDVLAKGADGDRSEAALRLGDLGNRAAVPHLIAALKDKHWPVRARAALSLKKLGGLEAVPPLVDALADKEEPVVFDAHAALKAITKQDFGRDDKAKWLAWHRKAAATPPEQPAPKQAASFSATVLVRKYDPDTVGFVVPENVTLAVGAKVSVFRGTTHLCDVVVQKITADRQVLGAVEGLKPGANLRPRDAIIVHLPK